jgi:hypothetical protein
MLVIVENDVKKQSLHPHRETRVQTLDMYPKYVLK